jgi:salicylate hydroxylase
MYGSDDIAGALLAYQRARQERVVRVAETARRTGERYHQRGVSALARNAALWLAGPRLVLRETDWIYRWQPPERTTPA